MTHSKRRGHLQIKTEAKKDAMLKKLDKIAAELKRRESEVPEGIKKEKEAEIPKKRRL